MSALVWCRPSNADGYSARSAVSGSTLAARRAGIALAARATPATPKKDREHAQTGEKAPLTINELPTLSLEATLLRGGGSRGGWLMRLPGRSTVFPLIVRELFDLSAVITHDEDFAVGLWRADQYDFVLEAHAAAAKQKPFSVG